jgi:hypothetical protein
MSLVDMSEREDWAFVSEGPEVCVGQATLARLEKLLIGWKERVITTLFALLDDFPAEREEESHAR